MALYNSARESPVPDNIRIDIIKELWPRHTTTGNNLNPKKWDAFFSYYTSECKKAINHSRGEYTTVRKHIDIIDIAGKIGAGLTKDKILRPLLQLDTQKRSEEDKHRMAEGSIALVARLVCMVNVGLLSHRVQGRPSVFWDDKDSSLQTVLDRYFGPACANSENVKFGEDFTAFNLQQYAGLRIQWTNNLANHLRLMDDDNTLCIYHHASFLKYQNSTILPDGLTEETLRTLGLLFPRNDKNTRKWVFAECSPTDSVMIVDAEILNCDRVQGEERCANTFEFWRDELLILRDILEKPRRTSILQFWYDRRNKVQWYTFWIAVLILCLTVFFGLVQSIEGALQVYKAYHPTT